MKKFLAFLGLLALLVSTSTWAIDCYENKDGGRIRVEIDLPNFTVPSNAVPGQKVWESPDVNLTVYCDNATGWSSSNRTENPHAWIKLAELNSDAVLNNPYLTIGVTYNGVDHEMNGEGIDTGYCLDRSVSGSYLSVTCKPHTDYQKSVTFIARIRLYVKLKSFPPPGTTYDFGIVNVLQFDGAGGANMGPNAHNLRFNITGLKNIHFLDCGVNIKISPESQIVNFGQIAMDAFDRHTAQQPFSISTIRDQTANCTEQFDVATSFYTNDTLYDTTHLDMGNGLLMRISDKTDNSDIEYNQYKKFTTYIPGDPATVTHNYIAELTKHPTKNIVEGPFSKDLIIKLNYQ